MSLVVVKSELRLDVVLWIQRNAHSSCVSSSKGSDYCYDPYFERPKPKIKFLGDNFCSLYTCSFCEGGCTSDDQCKGMYKCLKREPNQSVPGCSGGNNDGSRNGYCYDPEGTRTTHANWSLNDGVYPELVYKGKGYCDEHICGLCEGNCESDDDCKDRLVCYKRGENRVVPGCRGGASESKGAGYCVMPSLGSGDHIMPFLGNDEVKLPKLFAKGKDYCSKGNQCGLCEGDCDTVRIRFFVCLIVALAVSHVITGLSTGRRLQRPAYLL